MAKSIQLTPREWDSIRIRLQEEHADKPSIFLMRSVMQRELGFTVRKHYDYNDDREHYYYVWLDFYDDQLETLFRLKYL